MRKLLSLLGSLVFLSFVFLLVPGCYDASAPKQSDVQVSYNDLATKVGLFVSGDSTFQLVTKEQIQYQYEKFRTDLFKKDIVRWDQRFDCNHFATAFANFMQIQHSAQNWGDATRAQTLAIGFIFYLSQGNKKPGHAIVEALTPEGVVHIEPQTGKFVDLTPAEKASVFFRFY